MNRRAQRGPCGTAWPADGTAAVLRTVSIGSTLVHPYRRPFSSTGGRFRSTITGDENGLRWGVPGAAGSCEARGITNEEHRLHPRPPLSSSVLVDRSSSAGESNHGRGSACLVQSISQPRVTDTHPTHRAILYFNGYPHSALDDLGLDDLGSDLTISLGVMTIRHFHPRQNGL